MKKFVFRFKELFVLIISIATTALFYKSKIIGYNNLTPEDLPIYTAVLNIIILIIGLAFFSSLYNEFYLLIRKNGEYENSNHAIDDIKIIQETLQISDHRTKYFIERTSAVVGQLVRNFSLFMWPLIIFYALNIIKDLQNSTSYPEFDNCFSFYEYTNNSARDQHHKAFWFISLSALSNFFNFLSGIGLWVSFTILYQKTVDADNKSTLHQGVYYFLLIFYILAYIILIGSDIQIMSIRLTMLSLDIFCSVFNSVAMILFFNRLVQVLYFFQKPLQSSMLDKFYFFSATLLLPVYACSQIFFGVFDYIAIDRIHPEYYQYVKGAVFFICFLGKLFLILFMFTFIRTKWLHAAIITLLAYEDVPSQLAQKVTAISDNIGRLEDE